MFNRPPAHEITDSPTFAEAHLSFGAQMRCQLLLEHPARLMNRLR